MNLPCPWRVDYYFELRRYVNAHSGRGLLVESHCPVSQRVVNFVLTGDEELGYWTSTDPPIAWMSAILSVIGDR